MWHILPGTRQLALCFLLYIHVYSYHHILLWSHYRSVSSSMINTTTGTTVLLSVRYNFTEVLLSTTFLRFFFNSVLVLVSMYA